MKTILLIEDNDLIRENTAELLELAGYTVLTAENGKIGVEQALATRPNLVICDIMMPVLDGYGVLHIFNQNPQLAGVPFIFLTAKTERADLRRGMELGADDYLTKPFDSNELLSAVAGRLSRFQHLRPDYDLAEGGLGEFLADARRVSNLASLATDRKPHQVPRRQFIYTEGDEPLRLYFVQAGRVKTSKTTAAGKELITGLYQADEFFGYQALLERLPYHDSAVAVEDSTLLYIPAEEFTDLLLRNADVSQQFIRLLAGRERQREQQLVEMAYHSLRRRIADALLQLHQPGGPPIQLAREDLAAVVGTAPESLSRTLSEFRQDGLIELTSGTIRVLQPERLRRSNW
ncbi:response regulator [Hymenobacter ginsengisoli]|uniref:Response regulator n=1 Tax=Hymenobacter ginsengisoli TaxID=1051626 RepID=A0ABP8Q172_9BACT|nr:MULTISPECIES: response regulator [unclassified Hymenobacter]MBO2033686.1 response regulator [Hymenobacter sp. BT559]